MTRSASPTSDLNAVAIATADVPRAPSRAHDLYELTKPRMNLLVVLTTAAGYYLAVPRGENLDWPRLLHTLAGTALTAASAAVLNQVIERRHDAAMLRTRDRAVAAGRISPLEAGVLGVVLGLAGVAYLVAAVNLLTAMLGLFTLASYIFIYTPLKRLTTLNTLVGAVPGAVPPVMGWTAVAGHLSPEAVALFGILFMWQMPHFLAIAILYREDYARGGFKMLPVVDDERLGTTVRQTLLYSVALVPVTLAPFALRMAGETYFLAALLLGLGFMSFAVSLCATRTRADARKLFFASIIYLPALLGALLWDRL